MTSNTLFQCTVFYEIKLEDCCDPKRKGTPNRGNPGLTGVVYIFKE